ncbi:hypothetical protein jhhlp_008053 [Lomentospora prolificans]|uniref:Uncharacterized protein n=1 Tax=Lomentospora prolificans TaxID=41688 RepID=A0A2N3MZC8_9PEZI|nr:hypothetical protein jhhlp_008053 [Lomentospora prolificans]
MVANETSIYYGLWNNHDEQFPFSLTLTVPTKTGNYIIAALSALVAWAGIAFSGIVAYFLHQYFAARKNKDVLDLQLQVLFRSESGALESAFEGVKLYWAWKNISKRVWWRIVPFSILAAILWATFIIGSVLVANVASDGYGDVFVTAVPEHCGDVGFGAGELTAAEINSVENDSSLRASRSAYESWFRHNLRWARTYSQAHYAISRLAGTSSPPASRSRQITLPYAAEEVDCPWTIDTRCLGVNNTDGPALHLDTGLLDSHADLGINAPRRERVQIRKTATCGVVDTSKWDVRYTSESNITLIGTELLAENQTRLYPPEFRKVPLFHQVNAVQGIIMVMKFWHYAKVEGRNEWGGQTGRIPLIPTFQTDDFDMSFFAVATGIIFYEKVYDPLYFATHGVDSQISSNVNGQHAYLSNRMYNTVACQEAYEICNPGTGKCSGLVGILELPRKVLDLGFNNHQQVTARRLVQNMYWGGQISLNGPESTSGLLMQEQSAILSADPAENQWQLEVQYWFATCLSHFQNMILDWSSKPWLDPSGNDTISQHINMTRLDTAYREVNILPEFKEQCRNTIIRTSASVQNFNVTATLLVLCLIFAIIGAKLVLSTVVEFLRKRKRAGGLVDPKAVDKAIARDADDKYQLLRMALEGTRIGGWEMGPFGMPVTKEGAEILPPQRDPVRKLARYPTFPMYSVVSKDGGVEVFHGKSQVDSRTSTLVCSNMTASPTASVSPPPMSSLRDRLGQHGTGLQVVSETELEDGRRSVSNTPSQETLRDGSGNSTASQEALANRTPSFSGTSTLNWEPTRVRGFPGVRRPVRAETWTSTARTLRNEER